jgi:hypothetical protein
MTFDIKKEIENTFEDVNPYSQVSSDVLPSHVKKFIKEKKADDELARREEEMIKMWKDEIKINKGVNI